MSKNRPYIAPPIVTPPSVVVPREQAQEAAAVAQVAELPPTLAVVDPPARVSKVELLPDRIVLTNPTIDLPEHIFLFPKTPREQQVKRLQPAKAVVMHGLILVDEYQIAIPLGGALIRTS